MSCEDIRGHLSAFLDGELDAPWRRRVEEHLRECGDCRSAVGALEEVITAIHAVPTIRDEVLPTETILARLPGVTVRRERAVARAVLGQAGAGVIGIGAVLWVGLWLSPVNLAFHVLASFWGLMHRLVLGGPPPWTSAWLLGFGLLALTALVLALNGFLVLGAHRLLERG